MRNGTWLFATAILGLAAMATLPGGVAPAIAQSAAAPTDVGRQHPRRVPRITVVPLSRYYRKCDFWLAIEHRPSGDVLTPQQHCWWALR